jgi:excisionase family DNA binding protein
MPVHSFSSTSDLISPASGERVGARKRTAIPKFYTIEQIADCMDSSTRTVRRWIEKKLLIAHRIDGLVRISEADFLAFLAIHRKA